MGLARLLEFLDSHCHDALKPVDLVHLGWQKSQKQGHGSRFRLVIDADKCLDQLYGGFYYDWVCGGSWNRVLASVELFVHLCQSNCIDILVYFNGTPMSAQYCDWFDSQITELHKIADIVRHVQNKATPPPKIWWVPPPCLTTVLRHVFIQLHVPVMSSYANHHQELIDFISQSNYSGVLTWDAKFMIFRLPRIFSSRDLKIRYKTLPTCELDVEEFARIIDLDPKRFSILAALLGNHILHEEELIQFHCYLCKFTIPFYSRIKTDDLIRQLIKFVRSLPSTSFECLDDIAEKVFRFCIQDKLDKINRFKLSVQYFNSQKLVASENAKKMKKRIPVEMILEPGRYCKDSDVDVQLVEVGLEPGGDGREDETEGRLEDNSTTVDSNDIVQNSSQQHIKSHAPEKLVSEFYEPPTTADEGPVIMSEYDQIPSRQSFAHDNVPSFFSTQNMQSNLQATYVHRSQYMPREKWWAISPDVLAVAKQSSQLGYISPLVYHILTEGEIKLDTSLEDATVNLPRVNEFYRPLREYVYSILFDVEADSYRKDASSTKKTIREWTVERNEVGCPYLIYVDVPVMPICKGFLSVNKLWLDSNLDNRLKIRMFLRCFDCQAIEETLMNETNILPVHLVLCAVLRFMVYQKFAGIQREYELDAFLATALSNNLRDPESIHDIKVPIVTTHGISLATLFMRGVEHAFLVNDIVGCPLPSEMLVPWMYFDGKLFHYKLSKALNNASIGELCENSYEQQLYIEKMRQIIVSSLPRKSSYVTPHLPRMRRSHRPTYGPHGRGCPPEVLLTQPRSRERMPVENISRRGGVLNIAGVAVSNWAPNNPVYSNFEDANVSPRNESFRANSQRISQRGALKFTKSSHRRKQKHIPRQDIFINDPPTQPQRNFSKQCKSFNIFNSAKLHTGLVGVGRGCTVELPQEVGDGSVSSVCVLASKLPYSCETGPLYQSFNYCSEAEMKNFANFENDQMKSIPSDDNTSSNGDKKQDDKLPIVVSESTCQSESKPESVDEQLKFSAESDVNKENLDTELEHAVAAYIANIIQEIQEVVEVRGHSSAAQEEIKSNDLLLSAVELELKTIDVVTLESENRSNDPEDDSCICASDAMTRLVLADVEDSCSLEMPELEDVPTSM